MLTPGQALHHPAARYIGALTLVVLVLHLLFASFGSHGSGGSSSYSANSLRRQTWFLGERKGAEWEPGVKDYALADTQGRARGRARGNETATVTASAPIRRENATFVSLARNSDLWELLGSIREVEDRFNHAYHYPWVFLNEQPFSDEFKTRTSAIASGECHYGLIDDPHEWPKGDNMPEGVNVTLARTKIAEMGKLNIPYGGSVPYRKMCRYQSGFFWRHPLLDNYDYYWRVEPSIKFYCDITFDPFAYMVQHAKKYAFTISLYEYRPTVATLWDTTKEFMKAHPEHLTEGNSLPWISNDGGESYNLCHFWSNFEIAALSLWRSEAYRAYFDHLDKSGGFFYERWGDAPVHSIGAALFAKKEEIHFFKEIGYFHNPFMHVPQEGVGTNCIQNPKHENAFETHGYSCTPNWKKLNMFS